MDQKYFELLSAAILNRVPADGSTIGNQALQARLQKELGDAFSERDYWQARDGLIEQGVLAKGRGRGGSVRLADPQAKRPKPEESTVTSPSRATKAVPARKKQARKSTEGARNNHGATIGFEGKLWAAADKLRGNMDAAEHKYVVLGLISLKYISDAFMEKFNALQTDELADPYGRPALDKARLGEIIDLIATIGLGDEKSRQQAILGRADQYFLAIRSIDAKIEWGVSFLDDKLGRIQPSARRKSVWNRESKSRRWVWSQSPRPCQHVASAANSAEAVRRN